MTRLRGSIYANRGMGLEQLITAANETYNARGWAVVNKRPTPVHILRTKGTRVTDAVLAEKSTVDYEGCYRGHSLQFEAKQTGESSRFPLKNFHDHQVEHMKNCMTQGAIVFGIIEFTQNDEILFVPGKLIVDAYERWLKGGRASIERDVLQRMGWTIKPTRGVVCDYLAVVDRLLEEAHAG